jgi:hypothetical protein
MFLGFGGVLPESYEGFLNAVFLQVFNVFAASGYGVKRFFLFNLNIICQTYRTLSKPLLKRCLTFSRWFSR